MAFIIQPELISHKIRLASIRTVEYPKLKIPIRMPRSVFWGRRKNLHKNKIGIPKVQKGRKGAKSLHNIRIVTPTFGYGCTQFRVTQSPQHGQKPAHAPHDEGEADGPRLHQHALGTDKDAGANDDSNDDGHALEQAQLLLEMDRGCVFFLFDLVTYNNTVWKFRNFPSIKIFTWNQVSRDFGTSKTAILTILAILNWDFDLVLQN